MNMHTSVSQDYERILINIVRVLPPYRARQLVEFARFLKAQILSEELVQVYSVRIGQGHHALGLLVENAILWFWIGAHDEYERLLKHL